MILPDASVGAPTEASGMDTNS